MLTLKLFCVKLDRFVPGICDGCINRAVGPNQGPPGPENWISTIDALDNVYNFLYIDSGLSRADFYVLAGNAGILNAVEEANRNGCPPGCAHCRKNIEKIFLKISLSFFFQAVASPL